jgi:hypothetical protein
MQKAGDVAIRLEALVQTTLEPTQRRRVRHLDT